MKYLIILPLLLSSCVLPGEIRAVEDSLNRLSLVMQDPNTSPLELRKAVDQAAAEVGRVAAEVEERNSDMLGAILDPENLAPAGAASTVAALALNWWRNRRRKERGEPVGAKA